MYFGFFGAVLTGAPPIVPNFGGEYDNLAHGRFFLISGTGILRFRADSDLVGCAVRVMACMAHVYWIHCHFFTFMTQ